MNTSLTRSIGFWLLLVVALASTAVGGWIVADQLSTMTSALTDNTATGVDVYVGQSLIVVGAALLAAGVLGLLITLALIAAQSVIARSSKVADSGVIVAQPTEPRTITETLGAEDDTADEEREPLTAPADVSEDLGDQKGSSGSSATATKISVK
jgi:UPF0716 family protein affecting phage T7 exclusion